MGIIVLMLPLNAFAAKYTIIVDDKYVPYLQKKATQENMTIKELIENGVQGLAKSIIQYEYEEKVFRKKTNTEKLNELNALTP